MPTWIRIRGASCASLAWSANDHNYSQSLRQQLTDAVTTSPAPTVRPAYHSRPCLAEPGPVEPQQSSGHRPVRTRFGQRNPSRSQSIRGPKPVYGGLRTVPPVGRQVPRA